MFGKKNRKELKSLRFSNNRHEQRIYELTTEVKDLKYRINNKPKFKVGFVLWAKAKYRYAMRNLKKLTNEVVRRLNESGVSCYVWHIATTGSGYIRFKDERIGSVRIGDHDGRGHLKYKYNIRSDTSFKNGQWIRDDKTWRFFINVENWELIIPILIERQESVKSWGKPKYHYKIPSFKAIKI